MLKSLFNFKNVHQKNSSQILNKNILVTYNKFIYNIIFLIYRFFKIFIYPFQRAFITFYTVQLQLNRLPFRILPPSIQSLLIYFASIDLWILFFKRIKNNINLYIIREKKYPFIHRIWCIFFRNETIYYNELNIKLCRNKYISNFFYKTRPRNKLTKKIQKRRYNSLLFYYVNKLVFNSYPYFYWTYFYAYNKYNYNANASTKSQHIRTHIFFFFLNTGLSFKETSNAKSFVKLNFFTFKGIKKTLHYINSTNFKNNIYIIKNKVLKDKILTKIEDQIWLFDKDFIKLYYNKNQTNILNHTFFLNSIILHNFLKFTKKFNITFLNLKSGFKINWYTKVNNSIFNTSQNIVILFLRTAKHFNKGRYSRNRQLYRTGVYWCIWLNVIIVYSLHFYFYRVVYSFGYLWFPLGLLIISFFSSRLYKYRYYNISQLLLEFNEFNNFLFNCYSKVMNVYFYKLKIAWGNWTGFFLNYIYLLYIFINSKILFVVLFFKKIF